MGNKLGKQELWSNHGQHTEQEIVIETEPGQVLDANEGSQRMYAVISTTVFDISGATREL